MTSVYFYQSSFRMLFPDKRRAMKAASEYAFFVHQSTKRHWVAADKARRAVCQYFTPSIWGPMREQWKNTYRIARIARGR